jgi:hypothetical protein
MNLDSKQHSVGIWSHMKGVLVLLLLAACGSVSSNQDAGNDGPGFALTVNVEGSGTGHVTSMPAGLDCPGTCAASFAIGTEVTLTATPDADAVFGGFTGGCTATEPTCTVTTGDAVTAKFIKSGERRFARQIDIAYLYAVTPAGPGKVVVAGVLADNSGLYISARSTTNGTVIWEKQYPGVLYPWLTTAPNGDIVLAAEFVNTPTLAGRTLTNAGGIDCLVARVSPTDGSVTWVKEFGGNNYDDANAVAVTSDNTIYVAGMFFSPTFVMGTTTLTNGSTSSADAFLAAIDPNGNVTWAKDYGSDAGAEGIRALSIDASNNALASGSFTGTMSPGPNTFYTAAMGDIFVVTARKSDGVTLSSKQLGGAMNEAPEEAARTSSGGYVLTGSYQGAQSFGGANLPNNGQEDFFLARFSAGGAHEWSAGFGSTASDRASAMMLDSHGAMLVAGSYAAAIDLGGGMLSHAGGSDAFLLKLRPDGTHAWSYRYGGTDGDAATSVAVDASDNVYVVGTFAGTADIAGETFTSATSASFLVSYWP